MLKKYFFLIISILNAFFQLSESPIEMKNWISAIAFLLASGLLFIKNNKENE